VWGDVALANHGPCGNTVGDELDDPSSCPGEFGKVDVFTMEDEGDLREGERAAVVRHEAVEVEGCRFGAGPAFDLVDADEEGGGVFEIEREGDFLCGGKEVGDRRCEADPGFLAE